jgi:hypothetical protein
VEAKLKILGFAGSLRVGSYNKALLRAATDLLPENATIEIFDLDGIPPFNQDLEMDMPGKVTEFKSKISQADAILVADATASAIKKHYDTTLERVMDYYGIVTHLKELKKMIKILERIRRGRTDYDAQSEHIGEFLEKHNLIDKSIYQVRSLNRTHIRE